MRRIPATVLTWAIDIIDWLEYELQDKLKRLRDKAIRKFEPERCCPHCSYIIDRGETLRPCIGADD